MEMILPALIFHLRARPTTRTVFSIEGSLYRRANIKSSTGSGDRTQAFHSARGGLGGAFAEADEAFVAADEDLAFAECGRGEDFFLELAFIEELVGFVRLDGAEDAEVVDEKDVAFGAGE